MICVFGLYLNVCSGQEDNVLLVGRNHFDFFNHYATFNILLCSALNLMAITFDKEKKNNLVLLFILLWCK